jgi:hypothetical protein
MRRIRADEPAQNTSGNNVPDEMIIHKDKAHEHWDAENHGQDLHGSAVRHANYPHHSE